MDHETAGKIRGLTRLARIRGLDDGGETQTISVEVADGIWRDDIEVMQPYGVAAHVPGDGALALVFAVGGDEGHLVAIPVGNPSKRMGGLAEGDIGLYNAGGDKVMLKAGGDLDIATGASVKVKSPEVAVEADKVEVTAAEVTITAAQGRLA